MVSFCDTASPKNDHGPLPQGVDNRASDPPDECVGEVFGRFRG
jgi:hypothetical protein